jgi:hypothetical protein
MPRSQERMAKAVVADRKANGNGGVDVQKA